MNSLDFYLPSVTFRIKTQDFLLDKLTESHKQYLNKHECFKNQIINVEIYDCDNCSEIKHTNSELIDVITNMVDISIPKSVKSDLPRCQTILSDAIERIMKHSQNSFFLSVWESYRSSEHIMFRLGYGCSAFYNPREKSASLFLSGWGSSNFYKDTRPYLCLLYSMVIDQLGGAIIHGATLKKHEKVYLFCGKSGNGKTTISRISQEFTIVLSDELSIIMPDVNKNFICYDSPWKQLESRDKDIGVNGRLYDISFINKSDKNYRNSKSKADSVFKLFSNNYSMTYGVLQDSTCNATQFKNCSNIVKSTSCNELYFQKNSSFWNVID